nr:MAG TPA: hypothetical protein [Caudoviricetes sp.]
MHFTHNDSFLLLHITQRNRKQIYKDWRIKQY